MANQLDWTSTLNNPLNTLRNRIDISRVPFSDRGSRILLCQQDEQPRLTFRLAERLVDLHPGLETHRARADVFLVGGLVHRPGHPGQRGGRVLAGSTREMMSIFKIE